MFSCDFGFYGDVCDISVNCLQIDEIKFDNHKDLSKIINTCGQKPKDQYGKKSTINKYVEGILRMVSEFKKYDCQGEIEIKFEDMFTFTILVKIISVIACFIFQIVLKFIWKHRTSISKIRNLFGFKSFSQQHDTENSHEFDRVMTNALKNKKEIEY